MKRLNPNAVGIYMMLAILMAGAISLGHTAVYWVGGTSVLYTLLAVFL